MRVFRCDICAMAFDPCDITPNQIIFIKDPIDPRFKDREVPMWEKMELPQPITPGQSRTEYHICQNCFESIKNLLNKLADSK